MLNIIGIMSSENEVSESMYSALQIEHSDEIVDMLSSDSDENKNNEVII